LRPVGRRDGPHVPPRFDNSFTYNRLSSVILDLSLVISSLCWIVWALTYSCIIAWTTRDWELKPNCEKPTVNTATRFLLGPSDDEALPFISLFRVFFSCQALKNLVLSSILYLFWVSSSFFWFLLALILMLLEV
jgi:hypothetical protein